MTKQEMEELLPKVSFTFVPSTQEIGIIRRGESGYIPSGKFSLRHPLLEVDSLNRMFNVTKAQASAMSAGSILGWDVPAADPRNYDDRGLLIEQKTPKTPKTPERGNWMDKLPEDVANRLGNCCSKREDIRTLVDVKWAYMCQTGKQAEGFTKEDALVSILDLLDSNGQSFDLSKAEYDSLKHDPVISEAPVGASLDKEVEKLLPEWCYVYVPSTRGLGIIQRGEKGCQEAKLFTHPSPLAPSGKTTGELLARQKNEQLGVSPAQAAAMSAGSMFGWDCPAADPRAYDVYGRLKKSKTARDRSDREAGRPAHRRKENPQR